MSKKLILVTALISMTLAGCGNTHSVENHDNHTEVKSSSEQGAKPTLNVDVKIDGKKADVYVVTNMKISPENYGKERNAGEGHIHMYLDNGEKIGVKSDHMVFNDLPIGKHELKVSLHNNDHTPYDVTQTIEFEIK